MRTLEVQPKGHTVLRTFQTVWNWDQRALEFLKAQCRLCACIPPGTCGMQLSQFS